jgi:hypothetical protein
MARLLANGWVEAVPDDRFGRKRVRITDNGEKVLDARTRRRWEPKQRPTPGKPPERV